jgi:hypothetical protein
LNPSMVIGTFSMGLAHILLRAGADAAGTN